MKRTSSPPPQNRRNAVTLRFVAANAPAIAGEHELRFRVLREPLGHGRDAVAFPFDGDSVHLLAFDGEEVVGCVLFHPESATEGRLYQMAVKPSLQGFGVGRALVRTLEDKLRKDGVRRIHLHARAHAAGFYGGLGYIVEGEPFEEVGVPHHMMARDL